MNCVSSGVNLGITKLLVMILKQSFPLLNMIFKLPFVFSKITNEEKLFFLDSDMIKKLLNINSIEKVAREKLCNRKYITSG